jgi:hypothetical protein
MAIGPTGQRLTVFSPNLPTHCWPTPSRFPTVPSQQGPPQAPPLAAPLCRSLCTAFEATQPSRDTRGLPPRCRASVPRTRGILTMSALTSTAPHPALSRLALSHAPCLPCAPAIEQLSSCSTLSPCTNPDC